MTALILQARMDSTRLPGKCLLPLEGEPLLFRVMEALGTVRCDTRILACPEDCKASFGKLAEKAGFVISTGPEDDVLERYCTAIRRYSPEWVIRATADNPFVFSDAAETLAQEAISIQADYAGYSGLPYGAGVEVINADALLRAEHESSKKDEREHVCPYLYNHGELFALHRPLAPLRWQGPGLRITVDTREDYERAIVLYGHLLSLPPEERSRGENIILAYKKLFTEKEPL